ncbi:hypothetical protein GMORB2_2094 [Geosmithia morbida]|uniref:Uncharacterized protein n=1 Tax=Geosmithia morbida TaxID=1094350 RepID=A0A9P4YSQ9_9HYPO|nr:uncharacterized protein GMORB2_2094 [Geosmithia morbida]KAF4121132.1 hypothetical protein GMORB2_2094 [Geosmithia morbida]
MLPLPLPLFLSLSPIPNQQPRVNCLAQRRPLLQALDRHTVLGRYFPQQRRGLPSTADFKTSFPSPASTTPQLYPGAFDHHHHDHGSRTPRFAEEYSVFNTTPGNLRRPPSPSGIFDPFIRPTQVAGHKRIHSVDSLSGDVTSPSHVDLSSSSSAEPESDKPSHSRDLPLPPVDSSLQLPSKDGPRNNLLSTPRRKSPRRDPLASPNPPRQASGKKQQQQQQQSSFQPESPRGFTQTATPPPTARKQRHDEPDQLSMNHHGHHQQDFGQPDFTGASSHPQDLTSLMASPGDIFSHPMSASAAAPENYWDPSAMTIPMDMDFVPTDMFQQQENVGHHRHSNSFDWNNETQRQPRKTRTLAPKPSSAGRAAAPASQPLQTSMSMNSLPMDNSFGIVGHDASAVDPGILFGRPQTAVVDSSFDTINDDGSAGAALTGAAKASSVMTNGLRRSASARDARNTGHVPDQSFSSSPLKPQAAPPRPGLPRSQSDTRGKRSFARVSNAVDQQQQQQTTSVTRNVPSLDLGLGRGHAVPSSSGAVSPLKRQHRLSSLASIPESISRPSSRASVKFYIGADGRAHAEATPHENPNPQLVLPAASASRKPPPSRSSVEVQQWDEDYDSSSTDDEPIVIPSRANSFNSSFALPDPRRPVGSIFHPSASSRRRVSDRSNGSGSTVGPSDLHHNGDGNGGSNVLPFLYQDESDDAETVMNDVQDGPDAVSELLRVKENRQMSASMAGGGGKSLRFYSGRGYQPGSESCEMWQHGQCASQATQPGVYICAFCADMPNAHGHGHGRGGSGPTGLGLISPLAEKSRTLR